MEMILEGLKLLIESYGGQFGWAVQVVAWVGTLRLIVKPVMVAIETIVATTETTEDDKKLEEVKASRWYYWFIFVIDWVASIKIQPKKKV